MTLGLTAFVIAPLAYPGYMQVHSGFVPAYNVSDLAASSDVLRWVPHIATRFDPLRGDGFLAYFLALPLVRWGAAPLSAVKAVLALGLILGALGMYLWLRPTLGGPGACLGALIYTYAPHRIGTVIVRGAWGEALALGLLPFGMLAVLRMPRRGLAGPAALLAVAIWALIALSQLGLAVLAWLWLALWWLLAGASWRDLGRLGGAAAGVALAGAYTLWSAGWAVEPSPVAFSDHYLVPAQLVSSFWGFGASRPGWDDGLALGLGLAPVGLALLTLLLVLGRHTRLPATLNLRSPAVVGTVGCLLLFAPADLIWRTGLDSLVTYPWQVLGFVGLCLAVIGAAATTLARRLSTPPALAALIAITLLASYGYLQPRYTQFDPGAAPYGSFNDFQVLVLDVRTEVEIPPTAAGLPLATPGRLPLADYGPLLPGDTVQLRITWQTLRAFDRDYKLFVHLLDSTGAVMAQADPILGAGADPDQAGGDYFTSRWDPGRLVVTQVPLTLPVAAVPGDYRVVFGVYDGETLARMPVDGASEAALSGGTLRVGAGR